MESRSKEHFKGNLKVELYDLDEDIKELNNIADQHPEIILQMETIMQQEHSQALNKKFRFEAFGESKR